MGIITNLIHMNEDKKRKDRMDQINNWQSILALPDDVMPKETKNWAAQNLSGILGEGLGLKKKDHGIVHGMLSSLAGLNPNPSAPAPPGGAAPPFKPISEEQGKQIRTDREKEAILAKGQAQSSLEATDREGTKARLEKMLQDGKITKEEYEAASLQNELPGYRPDRSSLLGTRKNIKVQLGDGTQQFVSQDSKTGKFYAMNGEEISLPTDAKIVTDPKPVNEPAGIREAEAEFKGAGYSTEEARANAAALLLYQRNLNAGRTAQQTQNASQTNQVTGELSGDYGRAPTKFVPPFSAPGVRNPAYVGPKTATPPTMGLGPSPRLTAGATAPSGAPGATSKTSATGIGATPTATKRPAAGKLTAPATGTGAAAAAPASGQPRMIDGHKVVSPVAIEQLANKDRQVSMALDSMLGVGNKGGGMGGGAGMRLGIDKGIAKISQLTGLSRSEISTEVVARDETKKALSFQVERSSAYEASAKMVDQMSKAVLDARKKIGDNPVFWQKAINNVNKGVIGDPATDALVMAVQGFVSSYSRAISGGQMSKAQTNVHAQELASQQLNINMRPEEFVAIIKQAGIELEGEKASIDATRQSRQRELVRPFGAFVHPEWYEQSGQGNTGTGDTGGKTAGTPKTAAEFLAKHGG